MSLPFVYISLPVFPAKGTVIPLDENESFHLCKVLRTRQGEGVMLINGMGFLAEAVLHTLDTRYAEVMMKEEPGKQPPKPYQVHIAMAPPRHPDRLEWFVEKAVETGIDSLTLMVCDHSEKGRMNRPRLEKLMISALKQSRQVWLPRIFGPLPFAEVINGFSDAERWIATCAENPDHLITMCRPQKESVVLIGPEGDFSARELSMAEKTGWLPISLGPARLRTETAGLLACHTLHIRNYL